MYMYITSLNVINMYDIHNDMNFATVFINFSSFYLCQLAINSGSVGA